MNKRYTSANDQEELKLRKYNENVIWKMMTRKFFGEMKEVMKDNEVCR